MNRSTSLYLDIVRPLAAIIVLLSHASMQRLSGGQLGFMSSSGVLAVDIFFVLSGFVIAHVCATRESNVRDYAISRLARIYSVAIPAIILTAIVDTVGLSVNSSVYAEGFQEITPGLLIRSIFFIGEQWNAHRYPGSNSPYWSLGFEVWYYAAFGIYLFAPHRLRWLALAAVLLFIGPKVAVMFPVWFMGVIAYRISAIYTVPRLAGWLFFAAPIALLPWYQLFPQSALQQFNPITFDDDRLISLQRDYFVSIVFSTHLIGFSAISSFCTPWLDRHSRGIRWLAGSTFSIYLAHLPIMHLSAAVSPFSKSSPFMVVYLFATTLVACLVFAELSERRKAFWRRIFIMFFAKFRALLVPDGCDRLFG